MAATLRENFFLAELSTREHLPALLQYIELWEGFLTKTIPGEVIGRLDVTEARLQPLYENVENAFLELRQMMTAGRALEVGSVSIGSTNMSDQDNRWAMRADQAADGFRGIISALLGGLIAFSTDSHKLGGAPSLEIKVVALAGLIVLGLSWVMQKSKSLAHRDKKDALNVWFLRNEYYDVLAFSLFLLAASLLVFGAVAWGPVIALIAPAIFVVGFVTINCAVSAMKDPGGGTSP